MALAYNKEKFAEGEAAFARGITTGQLVDQVNLETAPPDLGPAQGAEEYERRCREEAVREAAGLGLVLGYFNGVAQAIRRIDNQMNLPQ